MLTLLIDAGNTRIKWAIFDLLCASSPPGEWLESGSMIHTELFSLKSYWKNLAVKHVLISNVAGSRIQRRLRKIILEAFGPTLEIRWFSSLRSTENLYNAYEVPEQLGSDRFAAALGARRLFPGKNLLIATCGTATTIDLVRDDGTFSGGVVLPGLDLMKTSLAYGTSQLSYAVDPSEKVRMIPRNTRDAIVSGCTNAQVGAIERMLFSCYGQLGDIPIHCILTGGAASSISPHLSIPHRIVEDLILSGLQTAIEIS